MNSIRESLYLQLEPPIRPGKGLTLLNKCIVTLILLSVATVVLESEPAVSRGREQLFFWIELALGLFFTVEYVLRVWVSAEDPRYANGLKGRLRYMASPSALLDLAAVLPVLLAFVGPQAYMLRMSRLLRVLRLAKLGRFSSAVNAISEAIQSRRFELLASLVFAAALLLITSTLMYLFEAELQPAQFGSIPRAMWWSVVTLTTVGYGDVVPMSAPGRVLAGATAVIGIGLIAMPTGILAAAFSDALHRHREGLKNEVNASDKQ